MNKAFWTGLFNMAHEEKRKNRGLLLPAVLVIWYTFIQASDSGLGAKPSDTPPKFTIVKDGKPEATIVIAQEATALVREPANDLREYVHKITGAFLPIVEDTRIPGGNLILVGKNRLTEEMELDFSKLQGDGFMIKTAPGRLVLAGHDARLGEKRHSLAVKRGTANAVNAFLHDHAGVRWFMPGKLGEVVPRKATLQVPAVDTREKWYRTFARGSFLGSRWASRNHFGTSMFINTGAHLWHKLIPTSSYFKSHPEWFAFAGGKRIAKNSSHVYLCTSNREMWCEALKNLKGMYADGYEAVVLCQSDGYRRCECSKCEALDEYRTRGWYVPGTPCDRVWIFHDYLARGIQETYPDRKIIILAYGPTGEVPHRLKSLPENVIVEWCHPTPPATKRWRRFHKSFSVFLYWFTGERRNYLPVSMFYVESEYKRLAAAGARGFCFCGGGECWGINAPTYYLVGQLLRNPNSDSDNVLDEFCQGLFREAASPMKDYFTTYYRGAGRIWGMALPEQKGKPYTGRPGKGPTEAFYLASFTDEVLGECRRHLEQAKHLAPDPATRERILFFQDGFLYSALTTQCFVQHQRYRKNPSTENLTSLKEALQLRERFIRQMFLRQKNNKQDLPPVFSVKMEEVRDCLRGTLESDLEIVNP